MEKEAAWIDIELKMFFPVCWKCFFRSLPQSRRGQTRRSVPVPPGRVASYRRGSSVRWAATVPMLRSPVQPRADIYGNRADAVPLRSPGKLHRAPRRRIWRSDSWKLKTENNSNEMEPKYRKGECCKRSHFLWRVRKWGCFIKSKLTAKVFYLSTV